MDQGTDKWLEWRQKGLGSSDAPVIMGVSPYKTRHKLWQEKLGLINEDTRAKDYIFEKGHRTEVKLRGLYELERGVDFKPMLLTRASDPFMRVSLDGGNIDIMELIECKLVGKDVFEKGVVPDHYNIQMHFQFLVTGFTVGHLLMGYEDKTTKKLHTKWIRVEADLALCAEIHKEVVAFWKMIQDKVAPELVDKDAVAIKDKEIKKALREYKKNKAKLDLIEEKQEALKEKILAGTKEHPLMTYGEIRVSRYSKKGAIDYKKVPEIAKLSAEYLETFRGKSSEVRQIRC